MPRGTRRRRPLHLDRAGPCRARRLGGAGGWTLVARQRGVLAVLALARSGGRAGTVALYQYTQAVYMLPYAVMAVPVATVVYPRLAAAFDPGGHGGAGRGAGGYPARAVELAAASTALVAAVALAGSGMLMAASAGAERFFALLTDVDGMGLSLAVLSPGLVGYALIYQVTRVLFAADRARGAALATAAGWLAVLAASLGRGVLAPVARAAGVAVPVAAVGGAAARSVALAAGGAAPALACSLLGALAVAGLVLAAAIAADRSLLRALRGTGPAPGGGADAPAPRPAGAREGR